MQTQNQTSGLPSIAAVISHDVTDFDTWKRAFDQHSTARKGAGIVAAHVNRDASNPNQLNVYLAANNAEQFNAFLASRGLIESMRDAGVKGVPAIAIITPVEDHTLKDRPLAGAIVRHEVSDFAAWKRAFDADDATSGGHPRPRSEPQHQEPQSRGRLPPGRVTRCVAYVRWCTRAQSRDEGGGRDRRTGHQLRERQRLDELARPRRCEGMAHLTRRARHPGHRLRGFTSARAPGA